MFISTSKNILSGLKQCLKTITPNLSKIIIMSKTIFLSGLKYIYCELKRVFVLRESWGVYLNRLRLPEVNK